VFIMNINLFIWLYQQTFTCCLTAVFFKVLFFLHIDIYFLHEKWLLFFWNSLAFNIFIYTSHWWSHFRGIGSFADLLRRALKLFFPFLAANDGRFSIFFVRLSFRIFSVYAQIIGYCAFLLDFRLNFIKLQRLSYLLTSNFWLRNL